MVSGFLRKIPIHAVAGVVYFRIFHFRQVVRCVSILRSCPSHLHRVSSIIIVIGCPHWLFIDFPLKNYNPCRVLGWYSHILIWFLNWWWTLVIYAPSGIWPMTLVTFSSEWMSTQISFMLHLDDRSEKSSFAFFSTWFILAVVSWFLVQCHRHDFCLKRYWSLDADGTYHVTFISVDHPKVRRSDDVSC